MGPTCSIIYENEPMENNAMLQRPRPLNTTFFNWKELTTSIIQGLAITAATLLTYRYAISQGATEMLTRSMVFIGLISANVALTIVNRSFYYSLFTTIRYKNNLVLLIIITTMLLSALLIYLTPLAVFWGFKALSAMELLLSIATGLVSVLWFEIFKLWRRKTAKRLYTNL